MAIAADFSVASNGDIRYTGTTANYTVLAFHRFLQDLADDAMASGDDLLDITVKTPSDRSTDNIIKLINGYNIDDTAAQHLYDGSITQGSGSTETIYAGLVVVGAVESGTNVIIVQNGAVLTDTWSSAPNADSGANIILRLMVKTRENGVDIDGQRIITMAREFGDTYSEFAVTMGLGNNTAALFTSADLNNTTAQATVNAWVITNTEGYQGLDVNGDGSNEFYYSQWNLGVQSINDLYEFAKDIQRRGTAETIHGMNGSLFRGITHQIAYDTEAGTGPATNDSYAWGLFLNYDNEASGPFVVGEAVTIGTSTGRILSLQDDGLTGSMVVSIETDNSPADNDVISSISGSATADVNGAPAGQATGGGVATLLAVNDTGTTGTVWVQLVKGSAPADNAIMYEVGASANTITVNGAPVARTLSVPFIGASTGSAIIGAYGIGVDPTDLSATDQLFDLSNTLRLPPNNVTFTVSGLVVGEDRVLVGPESGGVLQLAQDTLSVALTGAAETAVVMTTAIPTDTPTTGTIRILLASGIYRRVPYLSYTGSTYTIAATDFSADNAAALNNVFISYIDKLATATSESFTSVYSADRSLFIRVRDGDATPIKTFETTGTLGSAGGSATAIRTSDA